MPLSPRLARFNRVVTNRITRPFARFLPGFAVVVHHGRRSGRTYTTPVNAFRHGDGYVIVLTYTHHTDWYANVMAAGACELVRCGRRFAVDRPVLLQGPDAVQTFPLLLRPLLHAMKVDEALVVAHAS
jgi:deazaflavin-dependent oxidoreductase (nitroreductase family)